MKIICFEGISGSGKTSHLEKIELQFDDISKKQAYFVKEFSNNIYGDYLNNIKASNALHLQLPGLKENNFLHVGMLILANRLVEHSKYYGNAADMLKFFDSSLLSSKAYLLTFIKLNSPIELVSILSAAYLEVVSKLEASISQKSNYYILYFDCPIEIVINRLSKREGRKISETEILFLRALKETYDNLINGCNNVVIVDNSKGVELTNKYVVNCIKNILKI